MRALPPVTEGGANMANAAPDQGPIYFPPPRQELAERLREGNRILDTAMATEKPIPVGHVLVRIGHVLVRSRLRGPNGGAREPNVTGRS